MLVGHRPGHRPAPGRRRLSRLRRGPQALLEINVTGQLAVTQAFLPLLRQAQGRVVMVGSIGDRFTPPFVGPLGASKSSLATLSEALRQELAPWNIRVALIEPGSIHTEAVAKVITHALTTTRPRARYLAGKNARRMAVAAAVLPTPAQDALRRRLTHQPAPGSLAA